MAVSEEKRNMEAGDPQSEIPTVVPAKSPGPAANEWKMPEPVFRQTSGYLPRGFERRFPISDAETAAPPPPPPSVDPFTQTFVGAAGMSLSGLAKEETATPAAEIEPQPDVAEVALPDDEPAEPSPVKKQWSQTTRIVIAVLLLVAAAVFIAVFMAVVYYLFLAPYFDLPTLE